ncbi:MAG TPA: c-type cytochrome [Deinococcales bacterium]|nr:c-type cytochrome [Deinococcales bacterium]
MKLVRHKVLGGLAVLGLTLASLAFAQDPARLQLETAPDGTGVLTDGAGFTLYAFSEEDGEVICTADCLDTWQPLLTEGRPVGGPGVIPGLIGTVDRAEGEQVTFMGRPLYTFTGDEEPGEYAGQGAEDSWYTVNQTGSLHTADLSGALEEETEEEVVFELDEETMQAGQQAYASFCAMCHSADGSGGSGGPNLRDRQVLGNEDYVPSQILFGGSEMPSFKDALDDEQIAAISTYVRNSFGNRHGPVTEEEVEELR